MAPYTLLIYVMIFWMRSCKAEVRSKNLACHLEMIKLFEEYEYIQEGDIILGGILTVNSYISLFKNPEDKSNKMLCMEVMPQYYRQFIDFQYFIEQTNNAAIFPNLTLGYHIYDSCGDPRKAIKSVLQILSGTREPVPNYSCVGKGTLAGFIGDLTSETTVPIAQILTLYGYSQISYGATDPLLSDRLTFPYFFRTVQSDHHHCSLLTELLKYFGWTWVGVVRFNDDAGDREFQLLTKYFSNNGICIEFTTKINIDKDTNSTYHYIDKQKESLQKSTTSVIVVCGTVSTAIAWEFSILNDVLREKTLVLTTNWAANHIMYIAREVFNGSLGFMQRSPYKLSSPKVKAFIASIHPSKYPKDKLLEDLWMQYKLCYSSNRYKNNLYKYLYPEYRLYNCTGEERIQEILNIDNILHSPRVHLAVNLLSRAIYNMHMSLSKLNPKQDRRLYNYRYQLHHYLKILRYPVQWSPYIFDGNGEFKSQYFIYNYMIEAKQQVDVQYFEFNPLAPSEQKLIPANVKWKTGQKPRAQCSDNCPIGFRKASKTGTCPSCYNCAQCSEGEISNVTDSKNCIRCSPMEWPNEMRNQCVSKTEAFLSYTNDVISIFLPFLSVLLSLITVLILAIFIKYRDTPIVRANNRSLSFLLLVSIKLSFLSVFLFLGRPVDITCMLRNITFGITFSIAVSSLLAKTIMVCVAFKATKPGSSWRKWVGVKLSNSVVLFCSSIQIIICMTWLSISPPFQELDLHTYPGTIIIQCNEGSAIGFYSVIGYMGLLAAVSFVLAFLARTLPDSFNEAKYITFSMLLFCSVWITMIPAYLSTKGKNTVCVEIFAILTSSAGLLASIFLPKCYIILIRPEMNTKTNLLGNKNKITSKVKQHIGFNYMFFA
ncbi:vomeronasal type-2 receptor 26 [Xenopus laevis]|uniref:Vomeronasal type-2 receptor 26 n=1 Tax=Xenopus laevis TaxID=8355 RepID=A0A8J0TXT4_XENLA|nr:vomeronasal type-2 receptor 26 [Xenopus laevis]